MSSVKKIIKRKLTKLVSSVYDPLVNLNIGNQTIKIPFSHALRENVAEVPHLNFNLGRIAKYASEKYKDLTIIDIGANVGDTVAYIRNFVNAPVLCIDGDEKYLKILGQNIGQYSNVYVCQALVGAENSETNIELKKERGTAFIIESNKPNRVRTLENILEEFPAFQNSKLLKIDTDGFDAIILKASAEYLKKRRPVIYFEFDPFLIRNYSNQDPFSLIPYLAECGYEYLIFYMNNGEYLLSCRVADKDIIDELTHFFSGRNIAIYADVCAFTAEDKDVFSNAVQSEIAYFRKVRNY